MLFEETHNSCHQNIFNVVKSNQMVSSLNAQFFFVKKIHPKNRKTLSTSAEFGISNGDQWFTVSKCKESCCDTCQIIHINQRAKTKDENMFRNPNMMCKSWKLIYCIQFSNCERLYLAQTGNALLQRSPVHRQQISAPDMRQIHVRNHLAAYGRKLFITFPPYKLHTSSERGRESVKRIYKQVPTHAKYIIILLLRGAICTATTTTTNKMNNIEAAHNDESRKIQN